MKADVEKEVFRLRNRADGKSAKFGAEMNSNEILCAVFASLRLCVLIVVEAGTVTSSSDSTASLVRVGG